MGEKNHLGLLKMFRDKRTLRCVSKHDVMIGYMVSILLAQNRVHRTF